MEKKNMSREQHLLAMWFRKKYYDSGCIDEAIDWSNHDYHLSADEISEYIEWRGEYLQIINRLSKLVNDSEIYHVLRPWL